MINTVIMPKQGLQMTEGVIIEWLLKEGQTVKIGEPLFRMETDKLEITIDSQFDGVLLKIIAGEGETVPITAAIAYIGERGDILPDSPPMPAAEPVSDTKTVSAQPETVKAEIPPSHVKRTKKDGRVFITPRAKTRAAELNIDYSGINGSGNGSIIIERDILAYKPPLKAAAYSFLCADIDLTDACAYAEKLGTDAAVMILYAICRVLGSVCVIGFDGGKPVPLSSAAGEELSFMAVRNMLSEKIPTTFSAKTMFYAVKGADKCVFAPPDGCENLFIMGDTAERAAVYKGSLAVRSCATLTVAFTDTPDKAAAALAKIKAALESPVLMLM